MLNFLNHFTVPGVDHVMVCHDDQDTDLVYMVPELPSILRRDDGTPSFTLISFARDFTLLADAASELPTAETEGGLLQVTTSLEVTADAQEKIRDYVANGMGSRPIPMLRGRRVILGRLTAPRRNVKLTYPTWVDGNVAFHLFPSGGDTFVKAMEGSDKPSLVASNLASYTALLGQEGLRLIRNSMEDGWSPGTINYDMSFVARIPNISVTVTGKSHDVYEEIKQHSTITETYRNGNRTRTYKYPQVSSLAEMRDLFTGLHIEYDLGDFRGGGGDGDDATQAVEDLVFNIVQQMITSKFLSPGFEPGLKAEKLGTDPLAHGGGEKMPGGNQLWLKDFDQSMDVEIDFTFKGTTNLLVEKHPNSELFALVEPEQVKKSIIEADLSKPYFTLLDVPVQVTADFDRDPIAAIKVFLEYDQQDEQGAGHKRQVEEFLFDSNNDRFSFRTVMARQPDGTPKDEYTYKSQIIYKASAKSEDLPPVTTNDRNLIIGYDQLNCVNVAVYWGAIPSEAVQQVQVSFRYPGVDLPSATADVVLRIDAPQASWFTYTGDHSSQQYEYDITFFMTDGQKVTLPTQRSLSQRLIINAPFEDQLTATFVPQGAFPPVASIVVTAKYTDGDYEVSDVHSFVNSAETWEWKVDLRDRSKRDFQYRVDVTYDDGSSSSGDWQDGVEGTVLVGDVAREMLEVEVVPDLLDMTKWKLVIVRLKYDDGEHPELEHTIKLTGAPPNPASLKWTVPIKDPAKRTYSYQIQAFGHANERHMVDPTDTSDPLLVLQF